MFAVIPTPTGWKLGHKLEVPMLSSASPLATRTLLVVEQQDAWFVRGGFRFSIGLTGNANNAFNLHPLWVNDRVLVNFDGNIAQAADPRLAELQQSTLATWPAAAANLLSLGPSGTHTFSTYGGLFWILVLSPFVIVVFCAMFTTNSREANTEDAD